MRIQVPSDADAAVLVGNGEDRYGVIAAVQGALVILGVGTTHVRYLRNLVEDIGPRKEQDPADYVRALPRRLRWMEWARLV